MRNNTVVCMFEISLNTSNRMGISVQLHPRSLFGLSSLMLVTETLCILTRVYLCLFFSFAATLTVPLDVMFAEKSSTSTSSSQCTIASVADRRAVLSGIPEAGCSRDATLVASGSVSSISSSGSSGSSGGSNGSSSSSGSSLNNDGGSNSSSSSKAGASTAVTQSGRSAGALYTAGLRAQFWKSAHKVGMYTMYTRMYTR